MLLFVAKFFLATSILLSALTVEAQERHGYERQQDDGKDDVRQPQEAERQRRLLRWGFRGRVLRPVCVVDRRRDHSGHHSVNSRRRRRPRRLLEKDVDNEQKRERWRRCSTTIANLNTIDDQYTHVELSLWSSKDSSTRPGASSAQQAGRAGLCQTTLNSVVTSTGDWRAGWAGCFRASDQSLRRWPVDDGRCPPGLLTATQQLQDGERNFHWITSNVDHLDTSLLSYATFNLQYTHTFYQITNVDDLIITHRRRLLRCYVYTVPILNLHL